MYVLIYVLLFEYFKLEKYTLHPLKVFINDTPPHFSLKITLHPIALREVDGVRIFPKVKLFFIFIFW